MRGLIVAVGILAAGCTPAEHKAAEEAVRQSMFDPAAAEFRNVRTVKILKTMPIVCGEVNGKNRFGAFVGFKRFSYYPSTRDFHIEEDGNPVPKECHSST